MSTKKIKPAEKEKIDAEFGKKDAVSAKSIREAKTPHPVQLPGTPPILIKKKTPIAAGSADTEKDPELIQSDEESAASSPITRLSDLRIRGDIAPTILKIARDDPGIFPFKYKHGFKTYHAGDYNDFCSWQFPRSEFQALLEKLVTAKVEAKFKKAKATSVQKQESTEAMITDDSLNTGLGGSPNKGDSVLTDNIQRASIPTHTTYVSERDAWPLDEPLTKKRLKAELQYLQTRANNKHALLTLDQIFPFVAGNQVQLLLQAEGSIDEATAKNWRVYYANDQISLIKKLIELMPDDGVKTDIVEALVAVRLKNNATDASVAIKYTADLSKVLQDHGYLDFSTFPIEKGADALRRISKFYENNKISDFYCKVGNLIFTDNEYGKRPGNLWDLCMQTQKACTAIANAHKLAATSRSNSQPFSQAYQQGDKKLNKHQHGENKRARESSETANDHKKGKTEEPKYNCNVCGRTNHPPSKCRLRSHPHANKESDKSWKDSKWGNIYASKLDHPSYELNKRHMAVLDPQNGTYSLVKWENPDWQGKESRESRNDRKSGSKKEKYEVSQIATTNLNNFTTGKSTFNPLISARSVNINGHTLGTGILDSGAFGGHINNYVNQAMVDSLIANGDIASTCACHSTKVCTITGCISSSTCVKLKIELFNELGQRITIDTIARVVQGLPYNFIIGLTTIRRYKLALVFDSLFEELEGVAELYTPKDKNEINMMSKADTFETEDVRPASYISTYSAKSAIKLHSGRPIFASRGHEVSVDAIMHQTTECNRNHSTPVGGNLPNSVACKCDTKHTLWCAACSTSASSQAVEDQRTYSQEVINLVECTTTTDNRASAYFRRVVMPDFVRTSLTHQYVNSLHNKDEFLDIEDDSDNIDEFIKETPYDKLCSPSVTISDFELLKNIKIEGNETFLLKANHLIEKYSSRFRSTLTSEAARLKAFELELQPESNWFTNRQNKLPTRLQSLNKRNATREFVKNALETGLIEPSQAESWSQIHLTPKSGGKWRFCVDYRFLNKETQSMGWPLPNIKQMLERIGEKKPKFFAVLDLTQGYYQMAISKKSRLLTAFRTSEGLFQFKRLPMGLKSAPAFFQAAMQQTVLADMLYQICEVYLDDIIVYAETEDELLDNLSKVFSRLEQYNITLNPDKVKIGLQSVEYVGHVIDKDGLSFSQEKINDILKTPKPETHKQMKSFLGLCVQFKDHIDKYSDIVKPLHLMIPNYKTSTAGQRLKWTPETETCFAELLEKVNTCPKLFFMDHSAPVFLHTDASKYGIGGYLFQVVDSLQQPIAFISKTLSSVELRWSVPEKEGYAIFYSLMKLEHLLRDIHFTLRTDHKNLTFINTDFREKVKRWKLAIQHFDFDLEYIKGEDNIEADGFSRLCPLPDTTEDIAYLNLLEEYLPQTVYEKIQKVHNVDVGHFGVDKTIQRLVNSGETWKGMRKHVKHFVSHCELCQKMSARSLDIQTLPFTLASYSPFDRICVDTIGPLPTNDEDKKYILVIIDAFSRFVMLRSIPNTTAKTAILGLLEWIGMFGIPAEVVSDNGTQFANELVDELLEMLATTNTKIHAYSKEENAIVERANKEVNRHLRAYAYDRKDKKSWHQYLPLVQRILNASVHKSIGVSPAQIVFGNSVNLDRQLLPLPEEVRNPLNYNEYLQDMMKAQTEILQIAQKSQQQTDDFEIAKRVKSNKRKFGGQEITEFPINSYVLVNYEGEDNKPPSKLHTNLRGPLRVVNYNGPIYTLQNLVSPTKLEDFHVKLLHPFKFDESITDPSEVAQHDEEYTGIKEVLDHQFTNKKKRRTDLKFKILWEGDKEPDWYPWNATFGHAEKIHDYLITNNLKKYIPTQYTWPKGHVPD